MSNEDKMKKKLKSRIDKMDEDELERIEGDKSRLKSWAKKVLSEAWDVIKSAVGGFLSWVFL